MAPLSKRSEKKTKVQDCEMNIFYNTMWVTKHMNYMKINNSLLQNSQLYDIHKLYTYIKKQNPKNPKMNLLCTCFTFSIKILRSRTVLNIDNI